MTRALLATFNLMPEGEPGGELLVAALAERGVEAAWVCWDDPTVDWGAADVVAARSTWDYQRRCAEFLAWARSVDEVTCLLNGADVFAWNADKSYLTDLGDVPVIPTIVLDDRTLVAGLGTAADRWGTVVMKPAIGAGGVGVVVARGVDDPSLEGLVQAPWVVQPLVESVRTEGEISVYVLDGRAVSRFDKLPADGEIRVHELYGGTTRLGVLDAETARLAEHAVKSAAARLEADLPYARVDLMTYDGRLVVSELELIEPGLYLDVVPDNAGPFADVIADRARRRS
ncbi:MULTISPECIES: ATP-grasp domain-containing protein [unclassified Nocardioides]|uniref:ATP-grasp domain-containing protein n=1 Tax=unclassified Nocardioides TaxID=2615069 RepID=UPI00360F0D37